MAPLNELQLRRFDTVAAEVPMTRVRIGARTWATDDYVLTLLMAGFFVGGVRLRSARTGH